MRRASLYDIFMLSVLFCLTSSGLEHKAFAYQKGPKKNQKEEKRKPTLDYTQFGRSKKVNVQMAEKRLAIREQLQTLLKYEKDKKERPALLFRLAENFFEEAESYFNRAQELDESLARDPTNADLRRRVNEEKQKLRKKEEKWRADAIDLYKKLASEYPNYPGRDQVLYSLGDSLWNLQRYREGLAVYKEMITTYQKSKYVPDAYLRFGEYYFDHGKLEKALMAYKKVAEYTAANVYPYALYKQGWCYYNLHEWAKAKDMFKSVIALFDMGEGKLQVRKEALNDFTLTYSHDGSAEAAPKVFQRLAPKEAKQLLRTLAGMYFSDGKDKKAVILYRYLIHQERCSADVPFYQGRIVDASSRVGNKRYTVTQVRDLVNQFQKIKQCIKNPTARQKERVREAEELAEVTLRKLASTWYKEAKETKQKETFEYAQELFGDYLALFPNSKEVYDMRFVYAELLFHRLGRYERAASEYGKIVAEDLAYLQKNKAFPKVEKKKNEASPPGTYFCDAAYKSMQARREIMKKERRRERRKRVGKEKKSIQWTKKPIPKYKRHFIKAAEIFLDYCPKDEDILDVKYDIAKTYYDHYHLEEAIKRFDEIVKDFPTSELAVYAANLVLDAYNEKNDVDQLNFYARKYFANKNLMKNDALRKNLEDLIPKIAFKRIEQIGKKLLQSKKKISEKRVNSKVAFGYIKFYREFPKHELADEALFNASVKYELAERLDKARKARLILIDKYPQSELVPGTIFNLAENYERLADYSQAATLYERYAQTYKRKKGLGKAVSYRKDRVSKKKKHSRRKKKADKSTKEKRFDGNRRTWNLEDAQSALLNAGIYREALHQYKRAIADRLEFINLFPTSKDAPQVFYSLGLLYERLGMNTKAADVYRQYSAKYMGSHLDKATAAHMKRAMVLRKLKRTNMREITREEKTVLTLYEKYKRRKKKADLLLSAEAAAHAAFLQAEDVYKNYINYRFTASRRKGDRAQQQHLKKQLAEKVKRFKAVEDVYKKVALRKQAEWTIASLYKLGRAYEDFAMTFYKAPLPKGLTPEQLDLYTSSLRSMGQPYEDKAVSHFKAAVDKGSELGFYSAFTRMALAKLQHYRPVEFPREELGFRLGVVADQAWRSPLLLATWDEVLKKPELLDESALATKREESAVEQPAVESAASDEQPQADRSDEPNATPPTKQMADPAEDIFDEDEPEGGL